MSSLTIRLMSANGKGFSNAAFTMLNSPVAAAIPTARETTAVAAKPGLRRKTQRISEIYGEDVQQEVSSATSAKEYYHSGVLQVRRPKVSIEAWRLRCMRSMS